jgi:hypothetical protein
MHRGYWAAIGGLGGSAVLVARPLFKLGTFYGVVSIVALGAVAIYLAVSAPALEVHSDDLGR